METAYIYNVICSIIIFGFGLFNILFAINFIKESFISLANYITIGAKIIRVIIGIVLIAISLFAYYLGFSLL